MRELINDFYSSRYASCLNHLDKLKVLNYGISVHVLIVAVLQPDLHLDIHLYDHVDSLYQRIRNKALVQYFSPFISVDMNTMAAAFNTSVQGLEKEIAKLIMEGLIQARIDSHNKVCLRASLCIAGSFLFVNAEIICTPHRSTEWYIPECY